ncbi:MAG: phosphoribosyltransferase [Candidatus Woesearchaeota archaeon]
MQYKASDIVQLTWDDIQKYVEKIHADVQEYLEKNKLEIDVIVPILRGGAIPGTMLAFMFNNVRILPVQQKYFIHDGKLVMKRMLTTNFSNLVDFNKTKPVILVVEGNHSTGEIAKTAVNKIRKQMPDSTIIYVSLTRDYAFKDSVRADFITQGVYTNENRKLSKEECKQLKIPFEKIRIFPWESKKEEFAGLNKTSFSYKHEPR